MIADATNWADVAMAVVTEVVMAFVIFGVIFAILFWVDR